MSTPISVCQVIKATNGDEKMFQHLVEAMDYNLAWGMFSIFPCECDPPCVRPSEEKIAEFNDRLMAAIQERRKKAAEKSPLKGKVPTFDKNMAPMPSLSSIYGEPAQNDNDAGKE